MKVLFRIDGNHIIGSGHVIRCLSLADMLLDFGVQSLFVCSESSGQMATLIQQRGFCVLLIPVADDRTQTSFSLASDSNGFRLKTPQEQILDAKQTAAAVTDQHFDWVVVDHYQLDQNWERQIRPVTDRIMAIDDLANRQHDCELLLDQNLVAKYQQRYDDRVPASCGKLLGPEYALLNKEYQAARKQVQLKDAPVVRILVSFGGADRTNLTGRAIAAFQRLDRSEIKLDVVIRQDWPGLETLQKISQGDPRITLYQSLPSLASLMLQADLAIGAAGTTSWERCCLGLPSIVVTLAKNQVPIAKELHRRQLVKWIGHYNSVTIDSLQTALDQAINDPQFSDWSLRCFQQLDALGATRVASFMTLDSQTAMRARRLSVLDEQRLLFWANDPIVRQQSIQSQAIDRATHRRWFLERMQDPLNCRCYVIENQHSVPIGLVRFSRLGIESQNDGSLSEEWEVHYLCDPRARGRGIGRRLLKTGLDRLVTELGQVRVIGRVKQVNHPSQRIFENLGFSRMHQDGNKIITYRRQLDINFLDQD